MEHIVNLHIETLPQGVYLATSDEVQGLVAQGRTIAETIEIARDIAKKLIEAQGEDAARAALSPRKKNSTIRCCLRSDGQARRLPLPRNRAAAQAIRV
jgi:predicted RNase H-like HicB family nuclease